MREADLGEPLTQEDFDYVDSEEYKLKISNEEEHDEDMSDSLFEGDIQLSEEERQVLEERGIPGLREVCMIKKKKDYHIVFCNWKPSDLQVTGRWKWPKSADGLVRVPYKIPSGLSKARRGDIAQTVKEFKDKTCIRYTLHLKGGWATNDKAKFLSQGWCPTRVKRLATSTWTPLPEAVHLHWERNQDTTTLNLEVGVLGATCAMNSCTLWVSLLLV